MFNDILKDDESLFLNEVALDFDFVPKLLPYRENQQRYIAGCIRPLLQGKNGRNLIVHGAPGIGKTAAIKWVFNDLEYETDEVIPIYINCWQKNTTFKIFVEICHQLDYKFTQNKRTEDLFTVIKSRLNKKAAVFAFDEIDKVEDFDFLYSILEEIYKKSVLLITNFKEWIMDLDQRIKSRLIPDMMEFKPYNAAETKGIIEHRIKYAFVAGVWELDAVSIVAGKAFEAGDIRTGLYILREAGNNAESRASKKINCEDARHAVQKLNGFSIKKSTDLEDNTRTVLNVVKSNSGQKIGDLFKLYQEQGGKNTYKTFQRKIAHLEKNSFITVKKTLGGKEGNTSIIEFKEVSKRLTDF